MILEFIFKVITVLAWSSVSLVLILVCASIAGMVAIGQYGEEIIDFFESYLRSGEVEGPAGDEDEFIISDEDDEEIDNG